METPTATTSDFDSALKFVLSWEGGYSDLANDHGGPTNLGITQTEYDAWRRRHSPPEHSVRYITHEEAAQIYRTQYWNAVHCDELPAPLNLAVFDTAVNMGVGKAARLLQEAVGVAVDGAIGPATLAAVNAHSAHADAVHALAARFCDLREALYRHYAEGRGQAEFLHGRLNRLNAVRRAMGVPEKA